jgi:hypothetical protein
VAGAGLTELLELLELESPTAAWRSLDSLGIAACAEPLE